MTRRNFLIQVCVCALLFNTSITKVFSQVNQWTWIGGDQTLNENGVYGTQGIPAGTNKPGARALPATWTDSIGNNWMFGGWGYAATGVYGELNDLWKYDVTSNNWTWVGGSSLNNMFGNYGSIGVPSPANMPGGRDGTDLWKDAAGNIWIFGGVGLASAPGGNLVNDMWKLNITTGQWIWMSGTSVNDAISVYGIQGQGAATNIPGARTRSATWTDAAGNFWLYGGYGWGRTALFSSTTTIGHLSDLWKFNPVNNEWTWVSGDTLLNTTGIYGTKNIAALTNKPGARNLSAHWTDADNNFWMFGGGGYAASGAVTSLNDLWKYNVATAEWTWVSGDNTGNQTGIYGTQGVASSTNKPGSRSGSFFWSDAAHNLWMIGGNGYPASGGAGSLSDMWKYNIAADQWTWVNGTNVTNTPPVYGTLGTPDINNTPGGRLFSKGWLNIDGSIALFGNFIAPGPQFRNDFWKFSFCPSGITGMNIPVATGTYQSTHTIKEAALIHYCDCSTNTVLITLDTTGTGVVIPAGGVKIKVGSGADFYPAGTGFVTNTNGTALFNRQWNVQSTIQPSANVKVRMYYTNNDFNSVRDTLINRGQVPPVTQSQLYFYKVTNAALGEFPAIATVTGNDVTIIKNGTPVSTTAWAEGSFGSNKYADFMVNSFSGGGGGASAFGAGPLPLSLLSFDGYLNIDKTVLLKWIVAADNDADYYDIQRSKDGIHFDLLKTKNQIPNITVYSAIDLSPMNGYNYYRLKLGKISGNFKYSNTIKIRNSAILDYTVTVYPNPAEKQLFINTAKAQTIAIYNSKGQWITQHYIVPGTNTVPIATLSKGIYFIRNADMQVMKFVKL